MADVTSNSMSEITVGSTADNQILLQLFDNYVPLLDPGDYTINAHLTATDSIDTVGDVGNPDHSLNVSFDLPPQIFTVVGPRFALSAVDVHAVYPPANAQGQFDTALPHIVLNQRMVPWERNIWGKGEHTIPWMALLVLDRSEILDPNGISAARPNPTGVTTIPIHECLNPTDSSVAAPAISEGLVRREHIDPGTTTCQVFEISIETFQKVMPGKQHLPYFAHCRKVQITAKADDRKLHPDRDHEDDSVAWYSVVIASRFPSPPLQTAAMQPEDNVVHLVSLEGYTDYFDAPDAASARFQGKQRVRLVSLYAWTFRCLPDQDTSFAGLMHGLVHTASANTYHAADDLMLRVPFQEQPQSDDQAEAEAEAVAFARLRAGYSALGFQTRQGEKTYGWYRGPFTPALPNPLPSERPTPFLRASQAMIYDASYGVFDLSYGAAFEAGRLMALSSRSFGVNLWNWRRQVQRLIDLLVERKALDSKLTGLLSIDAAGERVEAAKLLEHGLVTTSFLAHLTTSFIQEVAPNVQGETLAPPDISQVTPQPTGANTTALDGVRKVLDEEDIKDLLNLIDVEVLDPIVRWLAKLYLLYDVPFNHLVADERMLPLESVRFFYLDRNWLEALVEGALSIGVHSSRDELFSVLTRDIILDTVLDVVHAYRDAALEISTVTPADRGSGAFAGMLLRSAAVAGWPGMEVHTYLGVDVDAGFAGSKAQFAQSANTPMKLLRFSRLSDTVLLCLFPATPGWIEIDQPKEGLHFATQRNEKDELVIYSRYITGPDTGRLTQNEIVITMNKDSRLLEFGADNALLKKIQDQLGLDQFPGPAAFAMQMIYTPQSMVFQNHLYRPVQ